MTLLSCSRAFIAIRLAATLMALSPQNLSPKVLNSIFSRSTSKIAQLYSKSSICPSWPCSVYSFHRSCTSRAVSQGYVTGSNGTSIFTWDDVAGIPNPEYNPHEIIDLKGFFDKIKLCNRGTEMRSEFIPFVIEGQTVGYIHNRFATHLREFHDVFLLPQDDSNGGGYVGHVTLHPMLNTPEERTTAIGDVVKCLGEKEIIAGIRNELYPVTSSFGGTTFCSLERAAAPYFGIKAYGVHMNGYVERDGEKLLWIGKRSQTKPTYPGLLDHLVAGGLPHGIACGENVVKECDEEAGIPRSLSNGAVPVGALSYMDINGCNFKRDVLFCYDLKLPDGFVPKNQDGEVESFKLIPVKHVANIVRTTQYFKPNCCLVIIDFLIRHGFITPECYGYLDLLCSLRTANCS